MLGMILHQAILHQEIKQVQHLFKEKIKRKIKMKQRKKITQ